MSGDKVIVLQMEVEEINKRLVVKYEGNYWNIVSDEEIKVWNKVEVLEMDDNKLKVKIVK